MKPIEYNFKEQYAEDTFNGIKITCTKTSNEVTTPIDLTGVEIRMEIKRDHDGLPIKSLKVNEGITLTDAVNGVFTIDSFINPNEESNFVYDLQFKYASGLVQTYLKGIFPVKKQVTV